MKILVICFIVLCYSSNLFSQEFVDGRIVSSVSYDKDNAANSVIDVYQRYLSGIKNGKCAMYPSCSNFGLMVFNEKPFFEAMTLVCDRVMRCSHDSKMYDVTYKYGLRGSIDYPYYKSVPKNLRRQSDLYTDVLKYNVDSVLMFVNHLINNQDYNSALLEIRRKEFFSETTEQLASKKLFCYRALNEVEKGMYEYEVLMPDSFAKTAPVMYEAAKLYYVSGDYGNTISIIDEAQGAGMLYDEGALALKAVSYAQLADYENSILLFEKSDFLSDDVKKRSVDIVEQLKNFKYKKPALAKWLSIIPGVGYYYAGHKGAALTSFIVNGLLIYATYSSVVSENYGLAGLVGLVSLSFYIGNISGAGRSAIRFNEKTRSKYLGELERINQIY
jgi:putative component of membrane protein insertase Oxa1/YidC/SpoIIIJ protein YidD